ncbi:MAG: MAPEG family protein [Pseudomonadota bacterium]
MAIAITAFYGSMLAFWHIFLTFRVIGFRRGNKVSLGTGGDELGERVIRAHGNSAETVPIFLILMGLAEGLGLSAVLLHTIALVFLFGRILHGLHFLAIRDGFRLRVFGMLMTLLSMTAMAGSTLIISLQSL